MVKIKIENNCKQHKKSFIFSMVNIYYEVLWYCEILRNSLFHRTYI